MNQYYRPPAPYSTYLRLILTLPIFISWRYLTLSVTPAWSFLSPLRLVSYLATQLLLTVKLLHPSPLHISLLDTPLFTPETLRMQRIPTFNAQKVVRYG